MQYWEKKACGVSFPVDAQNPPGYDPIHCSPGEFALAGELDWIVSRSFFQPQPFSDAVILQTQITTIFSLL